MTTQFNSAQLSALNNKRYHMLCFAVELRLVATELQAAPQLQLRAFQGISGDDRG